MQYEIHAFDYSDSRHVRLEVKIGTTVVIKSDAKSAMIVIDYQNLRLRRVVPDLFTMKPEDEQLTTHRQNISGNARVGVAINGNVNSDEIRTGNISGNGIAIGRGAEATVRVVHTGGGDYSEGNMDKRQGYVPINPTIVVTLPFGFICTYTTFL